MSLRPLLSSGYPPSLAEHGKFVRVDDSAMINYPAGGAGRYAVFSTEVLSPCSFTPMFTASYSPAEAEHGKFVPVSSIVGAPLSLSQKYAMLTYSVNNESTITPVFSTYYSPSDAEHGKFVRLDMSTVNYPTTGRGKYAILTYEISSQNVSSYYTSGYSPANAEHGKFIELDMSNVPNWTVSTSSDRLPDGAKRYAMLVNPASTISLNPLWGSGYPPSNAEHGKFFKLDTSTIATYPASGFGKYAIITYDVGTATGGGSGPAPIILFSCYCTDSQTMCHALCSQDILDAEEPGCTIGASVTSHVVNAPTFEIKSGYSAFRYSGAAIEYASYAGEWFSQTAGTMLFSFQSDVALPAHNKGIIQVNAAAPFTPTDNVNSIRVFWHTSTVFDSIYASYRVASVTEITTENLGPFDVVLGTWYWCRCRWDTTPHGTTTLQLSIWSADGTTLHSDVSAPSAISAMPEAVTGITLGTLGPQAGIGYIGRLMTWNDWVDVLPDASLL